MGAPSHEADPTCARGYREAAGADLSVEFVAPWLRVAQTDLAGDFEQPKDGVGSGTGAADL
jgi:hypothetical protein